MWWLLALVTSIVIITQCITIGIFGYLIGVIISFAILIYLFKFGGDDTTIKLEKYEYLLLLLISSYSWITISLMIGIAILNTEGE